MCLAGLLRPGTDVRYNTAWNSVEHMCRANTIKVNMCQPKYAPIVDCGLSGDDAVVCRCLDDNQDDVRQLQGWC